MFVSSFEDAPLPGLAAPQRSRPPSPHTLGLDALPEQVASKRTRRRRIHSRGTQLALDLGTPAVERPATLVALSPDAAEPGDRGHGAGLLDQPMEG